MTETTTLAPSPAVSDPNMKEIPQSAYHAELNHPASIKLEIDQETNDKHPASLFHQTSLIHKIIDSDASTPQNSVSLPVANPTHSEQINNEPAELKLFEHVGGRVLLTGASGFVANHCLYALLDRNYEVKGTVRSLKNQEIVENLRKIHPLASSKLELVEADLLESGVWDDAVRDCNYVLHTASPFLYGVSPEEAEEKLIKPALEGTRNVLNAIARYNKSVSKEKKIKRCVLTSSISSVSFPNNKPKGYIYSEKDWTDVDSSTSYIRSKVLAEKAAWEIVNSLDEDAKFDLITICPSFIQGPVFSAKNCTSMTVVKSLMERQYPLVPSAHWQICDVRDVALAHVRAMVSSKANGRYIINTKDVTLLEISKYLAKKFDPQGWDLATLPMPNFVFKLLLKTNSQKYQPILPKQRIILLDHLKAKNELGIEFDPVDKTVEKSVCDMAQSLIDCGVIFHPKQIKERKRGETVLQPTAQPAKEQQKIVEIKVQSAEQKTGEVNPSKELERKVEMKETNPNLED